MTIKIRLTGGKIIIPLNQPQSKFRLADSHGNHISSPTKIKKRGWLFYRVDDN